MTKECQGIGSAELRRLTGITYRKLDYWCWIGYIQPHNHQGRENNNNPGFGGKRCWGPDEVLKIQLFQTLITSHEKAWELINQPERINQWVSELAALHHQLTGELLEIASSTPVNNPVEAA